MSRSRLRFTRSGSRVTSCSPPRVGTGCESAFVLHSEKVRFERPEQSTHGLAHSVNQVGGAGIQTGLDAEERLRQAEAPGDGGDRQSDFRAGMTDFVDVQISCVRK